MTLEPEDAFGDYDPQLIRLEPLDRLPADIAVGGYLVAEQDGEERVWRVTSIADGKAVLDGNHELAGQRLRFDARSSTCGRRPRKRSRTGTCMARTAIITRD